MKYLRIMRPSHWTKNVFIFAALIFGRKLFAPVDEVIAAIAGVIGGFFCFSLAASAVYIFNDIMDRSADALHPEKRSRPIASGTVTIPAAAFLSVLCATIALVGSFAMTRPFGLIIAIYIMLVLAYSLGLKKVLILDCVIIAIGFCLRAVAGAVLINVFISPWLIICTFALSLFLAFGKRRSEVAMLGDNGESFRTTLAGYSPELLAHMLDVTSGLAVVCFLLYAMDDRTLYLFGTNNLVYTTPFVLYCVFRFSLLIQSGKFSGPVEIILRDLPFQLGFILWVIACMAIIYSDKLAFFFSGA